MGGVSRNSQVSTEAILQQGWTHQGAPAYLTRLTCCQVLHRAAHTPKKSASSKRQLQSPTLLKPHPLRSSQDNQRSIHSELFLPPGNHQAHGEPRSLEFSNIRHHWGHSTDPPLATNSKTVILTHSLAVLKLENPPPQVQGQFLESSVFSLSFP